MKKKTIWTMINLFIVYICFTGFMFLGAGPTLAHFIPLLFRGFAPIMIPIISFGNLFADLIDILSKKHPKMVVISVINFVLGIISIPIFFIGDLNVRMMLHTILMIAFFISLPVGFVGHYYQPIIKERKYKKVSKELVSFGVTLSVSVLITLIMILLIIDNMDQMLFLATPVTVFPLAILFAAVACCMLDMIINKKAMVGGIIIIIVGIIGILFGMINEILLLFNEQIWLLFMVSHIILCFSSLIALIYMYLKFDRIIISESSPEPNENQPEASTE